MKLQRALATMVALTPLALYGIANAAVEDEEKMRLVREAGSNFRYGIGLIH